MRLIDHTLPLPPPALSGARTALWMPRASLSGLVRACIVRDTRGAGLDTAQRFNFFPFSPACSLVWYVEGDAELIEFGHPPTLDSPRMPLPSRIVFCGPFTRPFVTWNPGEIRALVIMLLPDALAHLTGIDPGAYLNRVVPAAELFDDDWMAMCHAVLAAPDDTTAMAHADAFLDPLWQRRRPDAASPVRLWSDWSHNLAMRAANSGIGRSLRQVERRVKQWSGLPMRELRGMSRSERAFFDAMLAEQSGSVNWSDVASGAGYTDQSHLCRQTLRLTGFPAEELRRRIMTDETFWIYRLWGLTEDGQG